MISIYKNKLKNSLLSLVLFFTISFILISITVFYGCDGSNGSCDTLTWEGDYRITDTTSLQTLAEYTEVMGNLTILNTTLANLDDLEFLSIVGGGLTIESNRVLTNLYGLSNLTSLGGGFGYI